MSEFLASLHPIIVCMLVFFSKVLEITVQSLKVTLMVKGQKVRATLLAFLECAIWGLVISTIISTLGDNMLLLFFYCAGYALGLFIGSTIEGKIALGTTNITLIANQKNTEKIKKYLKENNRGFTVFDGQGAKEKMNMIMIVVPRKESKKLLKEVKQLCDNQVFEVSSEVSKISGGYGNVK